MMGLAVTVGIMMGVAAMGETCRAAEADTVTLPGRSVTVDDALFTGCFHNAFEGEAVRNPDGTYKAGRQSIRRTKGILCGADTTYDTMTLAFSLDVAPPGGVKLTLLGLGTDGLSVTVRARDCRMLRVRSK